MQSAYTVFPQMNKNAIGGLDLSVSVGETSFP